MPQILESEPFALAQGVDAMTPENQARAADVLRRYREQQREYGLPDFPTAEQQRREGEDRYFSLFDDLKNVDAASPSFSTGLRLSANPDADRARVVNTAFLARQYGKTAEEVSRAFPFFRDDFAAKSGAEPGLEDAAFYQHAAKIAKGQKAARDVQERSLNEGFRAAVEGMGSLEKLAEVRAQAAGNTDNEIDAKAFLSAYEQTQAVMSRHAGFIREFSDAIASDMDGGQVDLGPLNERLLDLPGTERRLVLAALRMQAEKGSEKVKESKGGKYDLFAGKFLQQTGEAAGRLARSAAMDQPRMERLIELVPSSGEVLASGEIKTAEQARAYVRDSLFRSDAAELSATMAGPGGFGGMPVDDDRVRVTLDAEAQKLIRDAKERELKRLRVQNEIRQIGEIADPIPNVFASTIGTSGAALGLMAGTRGLAAPALWNAYTNIEYNDLSLKYPQMTSADKKLVAGVSAAVQTALDYVGVKALNKLPGIKSLVSQPFTRQLAARALARGGVSFASENVVEAAQDIATPAIIEALRVDAPGFDAAAEARDFWKGRADVAIGLLPLTLLGIGAASVNEYRGAKELLTWNDQLGAAGVVETDRAAISEAAQAGDVAKAQSLLIEAWGRRSPEVAAEYQDAMSQRQNDLASATAELERLGAMPTLARDADGWTVTSDGKTAKFATWEEAREVATAAMNDLEQKQILLATELTDRLLGGKFGDLQETSTLRPQEETLGDNVREGTLTAETAMEAAVAGGIIKGVTMSEARAIAGEVFGDNPSERAMRFREDVESAVILGRNETAGGVSRSTINLADNKAAFLTALEEPLEGRVKHGLTTGVFRRESLAKIIQGVEQATGETFLEGSTWDEIAASSETAPRPLIEAISRVIVADVFGRMKEGKWFAPGSASKSLNLNDREQSAFAAILKMFRDYLVAVLRAASKLAKARQEGKLGGEYDALFDALTGGSSQLEHDAGATKEADAIAAEAVDTSGYSPENPGPNGETFSLSASEIITPENKVADSIMGKPAADIFAEVKKRHGVTRSIYEAGYILPDGTMLDFSGRADAGDFKQGPDLIFRPTGGRDWMKDQRGVDHREIEWQDMPSYKETWEPMVAFLRLGAVRVDANSGMISMHSRAKITAAQASALKSIVVAADGAYIDLEDDARNRSSMQLNGGKWGKVNGLLTRWANGETPQFEGETFSIRAVSSADARFRFDGIAKEDPINDGSRVGTAWQGKVKPTTQDTNNGIATVTPKGLKKQMGMLTQFIDGVPLPKYITDLTDPTERMRAFIAFQKGNLLALYDAFEKLSPDYVVRSTHWYDGARLIAERIRDSYNLTVEQSSAIIAVFSPMKDWFQNVAMGQRFADIMANYKDTVITNKGMRGAVDEMVNAAENGKYLNDALKFIDGRTIADLLTDKSEGGRKLAAVAVRLLSTHVHGLTHDVLTPEGESMGVRKNLDGSNKKMVWQSYAFIVKAISIYENGSLENISETLGTEHKIRNFYNNIISPTSPFGDATVDTHAVNAAVLFPMGGSAYLTTLNFGEAGMAGGGNSGLYWLFHEALREAAAERGVLPRQMQSITWEAIRGLFPDTMKRNKKFVAKIVDIWESSPDAESARSRILELGITPPEWARVGSSVVGSEAGMAGNLGQAIDSERSVRSGIRQGRKSGPSSANVGQSFSLRPGDFAARMEAKFSLFQAKPELRLAIAQVAKERALRLGAEWIAKGDVIRTAKDIGKEQAFREADGFDRRMKAYLDGLSENARQTLEFEPSALEDDTLVSAMLDFGKLMSFTTAKRSGKVEAKSGDYDGQPWLPASFFSKGAGIMPDQMAQAMSDQGLIPDAYTDTLWAELGKRIEATRKDKAAHREAVQSYKDAQKAAKAEAKAEAEAWANQARKTAGSPKAQRDMLKAALRTLDGILAAAPPEVRARVGGYVKLAGLATDEAMLAEIERRIDKMNRELEKYLKKEGRAELTRLFKKAAPKNESGEKAQGKIGPEFHAWFALAESAAEMSPEKADEAIVAAEQALEADVTAAQLAGLSAWLGREVSDLDEARTLQDIRLTVLQTFGSTLYSTDAQAPRNAAEIMAAVDAAKEQYIKGRVTHLEKMAARRERRQEWRTKGIALVGGAATGDSVRGQMARSPSDLKRLASDYLDTGLDASGFFRSLLGEGDLYQTVQRSILEADAQEQDAMKARRAEFARLLKSTFSGGKTARLRGLWELQRIQEGTPLGTFSQMQAVQFTLWFQDLDSREWLASHGYGEEWQAKAEKWLTPEAKKIRAWLLEKYGQQYDRINPVFRELRGVNLPRVEAYGGMRQVENMGKDGSVALTADNMAGGMAAGFTKTRVSSPTGPPKNVDALANYWGNAFQVEHYIAWAEPLAEMRAVVGHRDFRMAVESNLGAAKSAQMMRWIDDLEKSGQRNAIMNTLSGDLMQRWGSAASASALLFKVGVLLKQATAALGSAFKVGLGSYARSLGRVLSGSSSISLREAWNSDSVQRRINDYDPEMREAFQAHQKRRFENEILDVLTQYPNRALEGGWYAIGFTDAVFTTVSAAVAHDASYREGLAAGLNSEQAMAYAGEQMTLIVKETAQPDSTATKSQFENSVGNPWLRVIFAFQSANRQAFGLSLLSYKHGDKFASRLILGHLIIPIVSQTIGNMIRDGFTDADDDEIWTLKGYLASMLLGPFSGALQLGPLLEVLAQKTFGAEPRVASNPAATALTALGSILEGDFDSGDIGRVVTELSNILGGRASATGAGWNIIRQLLGLQENAENDQ